MSEEKVRELVTEFGFIVLKTLNDIEIKTETGEFMKLSEKVRKFGETLMRIGQEEAETLDEKE